MLSAGKSYILIRFWQFFSHFCLSVPCTKIKFHIDQHFFLLLSFIVLRNFLPNAKKSFGSWLGAKLLLHFILFHSFTECNVVQSASLECDYSFGITF